jgi:hypothetical protein
MGLRFVEVDLGGWSREATGDAFMRHVGIASDGAPRRTPARAKSQRARIILFAVEVRECAHAEEPTEEFVGRVRVGFEAATRVLAGCSSEGLARWRDVGGRADVFIRGWMDQDQIDLDLPPAFLAECARLDLPIRICTND